VFAHTSPFRTDDARFAQSATVQLVAPSSDTTVLLAAAERGIRQIYEPGYRLAKAGVLLLDLTPTHQVQESLIAPEQPTGRDMSALMEAVDHINARWGKGVVCAGSAMAAGHWSMKQERRSPCYTTNLEDMPRVAN